MSSSRQNQQQQQQLIYIGLAAAASLSVLLYLYYGQKESNVEYDELGKLIKNNDNKEKVDDKKDSTTTTATAKSRSTDTTSTTTKDESGSSTTSTEKVMSDKEILAVIEDIDRKGKLLFKNKQYLEAAQVFTEALNFIDQNTSGTGTTTATTTKDVTSAAAVAEKNSLVRQYITLMNNRSAMYEKANSLELSLEDCTQILDRDMFHSKARMRKLRILESLKRFNEALVEVCAVQLLFMQTNRDKLRQGIPVPPPPISQSKMEELLNEVLPNEMNQFITTLEEKRKGSKNQNLGQSLPSPYTILQLLRSYTNYNSWMAQAAKDGSVDKITTEIETITSDAKDTATTEQIANHAGLLLKRGRRYVYERNYEKATIDFESAYQLVDGDKEAQVLLQTSKQEENAYSRLLEWTGMVRHFHYELESALKCYESCYELEPTNTLLLVKQAGVQLDAGKLDEALQLFDKALKIDPKTVDALLHRSNLRMMQGNTAEAQKDLENCLAIRPNYIMARLRLAAILAATDVDAAKKQLDLAEQIDPDSSEIQSYRGETYFTQGEMELAYEQFQKAMTLEPTNPTPYVNAAMTLLNTPMKSPGQIPDTATVIKLLEQAVTIDPQFTAAYVHLGQLKLGTATNLQSAKDVITLYNQGLNNCRSPEEIKELCSMRTLAIAQVEAATQLKMDTFNSM